jgi:hypothetical protein
MREETQAAGIAAPRGASRPAAWGLGLGAALLFVVLASVNLEGQGPQYDELHQATGAFTWLGSPPELFCTAVSSPAGPVCLFNMPYSAAFKTHLYGAWLRFVAGGEFSLVSWRLFGILTAAAGFLAFCLLARRALPVWALALFCALVVSDLTVLIDDRFDWGPVAFALLCRMVLLGLWIRGEAAGPGPGNSFGLGAVAGFATFEKLSSCLLVPAVLWMVLGSPRRRSVRHLAALAVGVAVGAAPLALFNFLVWRTSGKLPSLSAGGLPRDRSFEGFLAYTWDLLTLGQGGIAADFMLGLPPRPWLELAEGILVVAAIGLVALAASSLRASGDEPGTPFLRLAVVSLLAYASIWIGLWLLPRPTWFHHWILATPFQGAAVVLALVGLRQKSVQVKGHARAFGMALAVVAALWLTVRVPAVWRLEKGLARGSFGTAWNPSLAQTGKFAAAHAGPAVFVASDWGVATQIYSYSNGRPWLVYQPFWGYGGPEQLRSIQRNSGKPVLYLVRLDPPRGVVPEATARIERDLAADPAWQEVPVEEEAARLRGVLVRKYLWRGD